MNRTYERSMKKKVERHSPDAGMFELNDHLVFSQARWVKLDINQLEGGV